MGDTTKLKVAILGQMNSSIITQQLCDTIVSWVKQTSGNIEFYILDGKGFYNQVRQLLSSIGMKDNTTIVGIGQIKNNNYHMKEESYELVYEPENKKAYILDENGEPEVVWENIEDINLVFNDRKYYKFRYNKLCRKVDTALVVWDGKNSTINEAITRLKVLQKPVYIF